MRQALDAAEEMKRAGVLFVPMPVMGEADKKFLIKSMATRLDRLVAMHSDTQNDTETK